MRHGLTARLRWATVLLAVVIGGAFVALLLALRQERQAADRAEESERVLLAANGLERLVIDLETGERGFVLTGEERFLEPWDRARAQLLPAARTLEERTLVPVQHRRAVRISEDAAAYLREYSVPLVEAARRGDPSAGSVASTLAGKRRVDEIRARFDDLLATERRLAGERRDRAREATGWAIAAATVGLAGSLVLIAGFGTYLTRAIVLPLRRASGMAGRLAGGDLAVRMPHTGIGEIGELEGSFNTMAGSLEASRRELAELLEQQASLRRVATLVAVGVSPDEVFDAVTAEVERLLQPDSTRLLRYESDGTATVVAARSEPGVAIPVGTRLVLDGDNIGAAVLRTGRPARMDSIEGASGETAAYLVRLGLRAAVGAPIVVDARPWGAIVAAWRDRGALPAEAEQRIAEFTELVGTAIANADNRAELAASRARVVAASDETRRRIERDLHDGAQQRLVSLGLDLRAAESAVPQGSEGLRERLSRAVDGLAGVVEDLQEMSRGIHPAILSKGGLVPALRTLARRSAVPVELHLGDDRRLPEAVEVAAYYVASEALTNAAKHADASFVDVTLERDDGNVRLSIRDDGVGGADARDGSGLIGLRDRVESVGGTLEIVSPAGSGTSLVATMPVGAA